MAKLQHISEILSQPKYKYFYEKRYYRQDGEVYVKKYSRSFPLDKIIEQKDGQPTSNVQQASMSRAKSTVRHLAFSNPQLLGLLTLTFADNIIDENLANTLFDNFRRSVKKHCKNKFEYLGVKERQKRGSIHYHLLVNYCPDVQPSPNNPKKLICGLWPYGFSDYSPITGDKNWRTELYLLKYLGKENKRLFSQHYIRSRGLKKLDPRYFNTQEQIHPFAENIFYTVSYPHPMFDKFIVTEYNYNIRKNKELL